MATSRRGFLAGIIGAVCAPAIVRADSLMKLHQIPERWATVWGVDWGFEVIEVPLWKPMSAAQFGGPACQGGHIEKFREVTDWIYTNPPAPLKITAPSQFPIRLHNAPANAIATRDYGNYVYDSLRDNGPVMRDNGISRPMGFQEMREWAESLQDVKV